MNVLFDLDGTLTDSREGIIACIRHALEGLGHPSPDDERLRSFIGPPLTESFGAILGTDPLRIARAIELYRERFIAVGMFENAVYEGVPDALMAIRSAGLRLFVATSKPRVFAQRILQHFDLDVHFDAIYGSELDGTRSSKSDLIEHVLADAGLVAAATVMIGDRMHDMLGARAHHVLPLGALWGYGSSEELLLAGAAALCAEPAQILPRLRELSLVDTT